MHSGLIPQLLGNNKENFRKGLWSNYSLSSRYFPGRPVSHTWEAFWRGMPYAFWRFLKGCWLWQRLLSNSHHHFFTSFTSVLAFCCLKLKKTDVVVCLFYRGTSWDGGSCFIIQHVFMTHGLSYVIFTCKRKSTCVWIDCSAVHLWWCLLVH